MRVKLKLDVLKPHLPSNFHLAEEICKLTGVDHVKITVDEIDQKTTSIFLQIEGIDISIDDITNKLDEMNCSLHSVDTVEFVKE